MYDKNLTFSKLFDEFLQKKNRKNNDFNFLLYDNILNSIKNEDINSIENKEIIEYNLNDK